MRVISFAAAVVLVCLLSLPLGAGAATSTPVLRLRTLAPFSVRGLHFRPSERVRVTLEAQGSYVRRTRASAAGTFVVTFRGVDVDRCNGYLVSAVGARGSKARLHSVPLMCAPSSPG
jgi:hypothetical protein